MGGGVTDHWRRIGISKKKKVISRMTESKPVTYEMLKCALNT